MLARSLALAVGAVSVAVSTATVSGESPYPACARGGEGAITNAEVEPSLAVDRRRPKRVVVLYQQDRYRDGAARGIVAAASADGGRSWHRTPIRVGVCSTGTGPPYRLSDPWVSIGPDGRVYGLASWFAATSRDGGRTWTRPVRLLRPTRRYQPDKGSLTADPRRAGVAYAVWARFVTRGRKPPIESDAMLARTTNGGRTWSRPRVILRRGRRSGPISSVILVDQRSGRLYHFAFWQVGLVPSIRPPSRLVVQRSSDGGTTWSRATTIAKAYTVGLGSREPYSGKHIRTGFAVPSFALDPKRGTLYAAWQDARFARKRLDQVVLTRSTDGGTTWTKPIRVSAARRQAFVPTVAVTASGAVGVAFYETERYPTVRRVRTSYELAVSHDAGRTFGRRRTLAQFDLADAPLMKSVAELAIPGGLFLGDYMGLAAAGDSFRIAFVTASGSAENPTDVRFVKATADLAR